MRLPAALLASLDLRQAVEHEVAHPGGLLPKRSIEAALQSHVEEVAEYLENLYEKGLEPAGADEIQAPKAGRGLRPLSILGFPERVLFDALTARAALSAPSTTRDWENWEEFAGAPLEHENTAYVVNADVSAFYLYVDHELLETELVAQTGDAAGASAIAAFLHGVMQRRFGLPQLYRGSHFLSEIVIDIVERRLLRLGLPVWRFNDDFRIPSSSWRESQELIETLDREVRRAGLTLNEEKTWAQKTENYREWLEEPDRVWSEINQRVDFDFRAYDPYSGQLVPGTAGPDEDEGEEAADPEELEAASIRALEYWNDISYDEEHIPLRVYRRLLSRAMWTLTWLGSPAGLGYARRVLAVEPQLAPTVGRYIAAASVGDQGAAGSELEGLVRDEGLT